MKLKTTRASACLLNLTLFLAMFGIFSGMGHAQVEGDATSSDFGSAGPQVPTSVDTTVGEITEIPLNSIADVSGAESRASGQCHRQEVTMTYEDAKGAFIRFTGVKRWCYNGQSVTFGTMDVETWIRPDSQYGPSRDGYRYVGSELRKSDRFLTYKGHRNGSHESVRVGRFEWRALGFDRAAQVLNPYVSRTGRYNGECDGPKPKDVSPKVTAVRPTGGAKGVSPSANVEATFNRNIDAKAVKGRTFQLVKRGTFDTVSASIRYDAAKRKAILNPSRPLALGTYTATVFSGPFGVLTSENDPLIADKT